MLWERIVVSNHERLLLARNGEFDRILSPGEYRIGVLPFHLLEMERHDVRKLVFKSAWTEYLMREHPAIIDRHFVKIETAETEVAMIYANGELFRVLEPAKRLLFWRGVARIEAEIVTVIADVTEALAFRE